MYQQPSPLDVGEEVVAEANAVGRTLDQPGNVGDHQLAIVLMKRAENRGERGEWIVGDLWRCAGEHRDQRRLARVGQAHEADVGEQLELQREPALVADETALGEARALARGAREVAVAAST